MAVLAIYTNKYPYGKAETFLESEVTHLSNYFEEIIIVPFYGNGKKRCVPENVRTLLPIQDKKWSRLKIYFVGFLNFYRIFAIPELKKELKNFPFLKCLKYLGYALVTKRLIEKKLPSQSSVHYSYWLDFSAFSLSLLKKEGKIQTVISRAHGYDLYEDRGEKSLNFIRGATLKNLSGLYLISDYGRNYLLTLFPEYSKNYYVFRLGTTDPGFINPTPDRISLTLASCSVINTNKRVNLILESLVRFNSRFPAIKVNWYHLGGGAEIMNYIDKASEVLNESFIECHFPGEMTNTEIFNFYRSVPFDIFINVSESEGLPVSIMEAQSVGIPVIATGVGGTPEIVNNENGLLLNTNPLAEDIASAFFDVTINKEKWEAKRVLSRQNWEQRFNAKMNYDAFAAELLFQIDKK